MTITLFTTIAVLTALLAYQYSMLKTRKADCQRLREHIASLETLLNERKASSDASAEVPSSTETDSPHHKHHHKGKHAFMEQFCDILSDRISNHELSVEEIAKEMNVSRTLLFKNVKHHTGMTPNNFIRVRRLEKASELIASGKYRINEICWMVGFNTPSYFSKCFYEHYGKHPKDFMPETEN